MRFSILRMAILVCLSMASLFNLDMPSVARANDLPQWSVRSMTMTSRFPKGIDFSIDAISNGGKITLAVLNWQFAPDSFTRQIAKIDSFGEATASWTPNFAQGDGAPQELSVEYWWWLQDDQGNTFATSHSFSDYTDNSQIWLRAESDDGVVIWEQGVPDEIGTMALTGLKTAQSKYMQIWGTPLNYKPRLIIYADYHSFDEWLPGADHTDSAGNHTISLTCSCWGGAVFVYNPKTGTQVIGYGSVPHEVEHLHQAFSGILINVGNACWFIEGDATSFEQQQRYDYLARAQQLAKTNRLPKLANISKGCGSSNWRDAYDTGYAFFVWLNVTYGSNAQHKVWDQLSQGASLNDALQTVTGLSFADMEKTFRAWLLHG